MNHISKIVNMQVRRQVGAREAVRHRETPLPLDHQEQEPPMGQIDISLLGLSPTFGQIDISSIRCMLIAFLANISQQHLTNLKNGAKFILGGNNLNKLVAGELCVQTFIQLINSALEYNN